MDVHLPTFQVKLRPFLFTGWYAVANRPISKAMIAMMHFMGCAVKDVASGVARRRRSVEYPMTRYVLIQQQIPSTLLEMRECCEPASDGRSDLRRQQNFVLQFVRLRC
jgi:hypothetical protein